MGKIVKRIKSAVADLVDPDKDERISNLVRVIEHGLQTKLQSFSLTVAIHGIDCNEKELESAKEKVLRNVVARGWEDEILTSGQKHVNGWITGCLEIPVARASSGRSLRVVLHVYHRRKHN